MNVKRSDVYATTCPRCGAPPGQSCLDGRSWGKSCQPHAERHQAAKAAKAARS